MMYFAIGGVLFLLIVIWVVNTFNRFKRLLVKIDESESGIDVALTNRYDTITQMVRTVKAYAKHEADIFTKLVQLRQGMNMAEKCSACAKMDEAAQKLVITAEAYPELRSSENYLKLKAAISETESHLQAARRLYNANVSAFNQAIVVFPASMLAGGYREKEFFEASAAKRMDVHLDL